MWHGALTRGCTADGQAGAAQHCHQGSAQDVDTDAGEGGERALQARHLTRILEGVLQREGGCEWGSLVGDGDAVTPRTRAMDAPPPRGPQSTRWQP